tara:strand:- start:8396 stop:10099 length:1704 start_codon:yes stop_codon:yes gene_type:complete
MFRSFKYLFKREIEVVSRLRSSLKKNVQPGRKSRRAKKINLFLSGPPPVQRITFRRRYPRLTSLLAIGISLVLHIGVGLMIYIHLFERPPPPEKNEITVTIRLPSKTPPRKKPGELKKPRPEEKNPEKPEPVKKVVKAVVKPRPLPPKTTPREVKKKPAVVKSPRKTKAPNTRSLRQIPKAPPLGMGASPPGLTAGGAKIGGGVLGSRGRDAKLAALQRYGGSGRTENAVDKGLAWLAAHQDSDGGWDAKDYQRHCRHHRPCKGQGLGEFDMGVTALATLAFLGSGHSPNKEGPYRRHVTKALKHLTDAQSGIGSFEPRGDKYNYNHALATLALAEAYAMTRDSFYKDSLQSALRYSFSSQQAGGGWDYSSIKTGRNDLSITGWQVMALRAAQKAGIAIPARIRQNLSHFLNRAFTPSGYGIYANLEPEAGRMGANMVAVALMTHLYNGGLASDSRARKAVSRLVKGNPPEIKGMARWELSYQSYYYWYTATLALFNVGGKTWEAWNTLLQQKVLPLQDRDPHSSGSWAPEPNWVGRSGGRIYSTAINVLTLEVYYRYRPVFAVRKS